MLISGVPLQVSKVASPATKTQVGHVSVWKGLVRDLDCSRLCDSRGWKNFVMNVR